MPLTVNGEPAFTDPGAPMLEAVTFTSVVALIAVVASALVSELFPAVESTTCN
jgi:hypothetical protein